jgi:hypothetical protein
MRRIVRLPFVLVLCITSMLSANACLAVSDCIDSGVSFSDGAISCQSGYQFKCSDGDWKALDLVCKEPPPMPTVANPAACSCTENEIKSCDQSAQACCVSLVSGICTKNCCPK